MTPPLCISEISILRISSGVVQECDRCIAICRSRVDYVSCRNSCAKSRCGCSADMAALDVRSIFAWPSPCSQWGMLEKCLSDECGEDGVLDGCGKCLEGCAHSHAYCQEGCPCKCVTARSGPVAEFAILMAHCVTTTAGTLPGCVVNSCATDLKYREMDTR